MTNVLIVDDERLIQELFSHYITMASDRYALVDTIKNAANALLICESKRIDLVLMDVCTAEDESGLDATRSIKAKFPDIKVIIVTSAPEYSFISKARSIGADSFWYKELSSQNLLDVMDRTMQGESVYPPAIPSVKMGLASSSELTPKELQVLRHLVEGCSISEIADLMGVDYGTTKTHLRHLKEKTGARNNAELAVMAVKTKLVMPDF